MTGQRAFQVRQISIRADDAGVRLDRWFRRHFPNLPHGRLEKLLRTGQVRVDGRRASAGQRLGEGQTIRVPPIVDAPTPPSARPAVPEREAEAVRAMVLYCDDDVLVVNKPAGMAVQGGTKAGRHLDSLLDALRLGREEPPRLVHRLDRDTSGILVLARSRSAARHLAGAFRARDASKLYWAAVVGVPRVRAGRISQPLAKVTGSLGERVATGGEDGRPAVTRYRLIDSAGKRVSWLALWPLTGRTHQLRVHVAEMGTPILGDRKYGGEAAAPPIDGVADRLHLHARRIALPLPEGRMLDVIAPMPPHMVATWDYVGFSVAMSGADAVEAPR